MGSYGPRSLEYHRWHRKLDTEFGVASSHICPCGSLAIHWAYQHNGGEDERVTEWGGPYALRTDCYLPMCFGCHTRLDDPGFSRLSAAGKKGGAARTAKMNSDPEFYQRSLNICSEGGKVGGVSAGLVRRRCSSCGLVTTSGPLKKHQSARGHSGFSDISLLVLLDLWQGPFPHLKFVFRH